MALRGSVTAFVPSALLAGALVIMASAPVQAQDEQWNNPGTGSAPCIVLNSYSVEPDQGEGSNGYRGFAAIENICGRAVVTSFCFDYAQPAQGQEMACFEGALRPWSHASVESEPVGVRIVGPDYKWRYLD